MAIQITKTITISGQQIVRDYICETLGLTVQQYNEQFSKKQPQIYWEIEESGDHDKGDYKQELKELEITIEE